MQHGKLIGKFPMGNEKGKLCIYNNMYNIYNIYTIAYNQVTIKYNEEVYVRLYKLINFQFS